MISLQRLSLFLSLPLIFSLPLIGYQVTFSPPQFLPGVPVRVIIATESGEKDLQAFENGVRRVLYRIKEGNSAGYHFYSGYDVEKFPSKISFTFSSSKTNSEHLFTMEQYDKPVPILGTVPTSGSNALSILSDKTLSQNENQFFHRFFAIESMVEHARGPWVMPVSNVRITSPFGNRREYSDGTVRFHRGIDFGANIGTPVVAVNNGVVLFSGEKRVRGKVVVLDHGCGVFTEYWHLDSLAVTGGQLIAKGTQIGTVGNTGLSTGPHLHFGVRIKNNAVDGGYFLRGAIYLTDID